MRPLRFVLVLCSFVFGLFICLQRVSACSFSDPDTAVINAADKEIILLGYRICNTGVRVPDFTGWSGGTCLIEGTCKGTAKRSAWLIQLDARKITPITIDDEKAFLCGHWPFNGKQTLLYDFNINRPEDNVVGSPVSLPFDVCTQYERKATGAPDIVRKQFIFGTKNFTKGLPDGWKYIPSGLNPERGIAFENVLVDLSHHEPQFLDISIGK